MNNEILLKLSGKIETLQRKIREKQIEFQVNANATGPPPPPSRPLPDFSRVPGHVVAHRPRLFHDLHSEQTRDELQKVTLTNTETKLDFENLTEAIKVVGKSVALNQALNLSTEGTVQLDEEEIGHVKGLQSEIQELFLRIVEAEEQRLDSEIELREAKSELYRQYAYLHELFPTSTTESEKGEQGVPIADKTEKKKKQLTHEEAKVNQMKMLIQRLAFALPSEDCDKEVQDKNDRMLLRCGLSVEKLRGDSA